MFARFPHLIFAAWAAFFGVTAEASAQAYPTRPITVVVPFPAGGPTDTVARVIADRMQLSLGQPLIVENVTGASGSIAVGRVAHAAPDGYTLSFGNWSTHVVNGAALALSYGVLNDFAPVALISDSPMVLVTKDIPANTLQEFVGWLKANPGKSSQGTPGVAGAAHLAGVLFQNITDTRFQFVPYRGVGPAMQDLLGGRIDFMFDFVANSQAQIQSGKLKALAVLSKTRLELLPNVPNVDEAGVPGLYVPSWQAIWVPKATPDTIVARLNSAVKRVLDEAATRQRLIGLAQTIPERDQQTIEALGALHRAEIKKWWPIIKATGIKAE
jgi:tripartite-type tricarboxylate transporter receptor subunit TctC